MKNKKIKKLAKLIHEEVRNYERADKPVKAIDDYGNDWSEYDPEVSEKFKKMILNLSNYKNNINVSVDDNRINISTGDIKTIKTPLPGSKRNSLYSDDNYLEMSLIKNVGFTINYGYKLRTNYKDEKLFDELHPIISKTLKEINANNFNEIWVELMRESGILRDNNLDNILDG